MFKMILRQTWKGFLNLSQAPATGKRNGQSYRTGFARACWAVGGLFIYFLIHYVLLNGSEEGSEDNHGIYLLLLGAAIAAGIGAFLAPRINAYLYQYTPQGRRNAKSKKQLSSRNANISKKSKNSSSSSQSSSSHSSSSSSANRSSKSTSN